MQTNKVQTSQKYNKVLNPEALLMQEWHHSDLLPLESVFDKLLRSSFPDMFKMGIDVTGNAYPKGNIYETDTSLEMMFELAGLAKEDIKIAVTDYDAVAKVVTLSGKKSYSNEENNSNKSWFLRELKHSNFERKFIIREIHKYDFDNLNASFKDGVLLITIPKKDPRKSEGPATKFIEIT